MAAVRESCGNMKVGVYLKMKRIIAFAAAAVMLASMAGCGDSSSKGEAASSSVSSQAVYSAAASKLTSKMTETEKKRTSIHELTLLDKPKEEDDLTPIQRENLSLDDLQKTWMARLGEDCIFISAKNKDNIDALRALMYDRIKAIHIKRYPYNDFLFQNYDV